jgi:hypothetical protein
MQPPYMNEDRYLHKSFSIGDEGPSKDDLGPQGIGCVLHPLWCCKERGCRKPSGGEKNGATSQ